MYPVQNVCAYGAVTAMSQVANEQFLLCLWLLHVSEAAWGL